MDMALEALEASPTEPSKPVSTDIDIEKVREAASAHFDDLTEDQKQAAKSFFETMDKDKSGNISVEEFMTFLSHAGLEDVDTDNLFAELDKDNNGTLSFKELVIFFYVLSRDEYKHLLKRRLVLMYPERIGRRTAGGANDEGRRWTTGDFLGLYRKLKGVYKLEEWVNENACSIL
ncbi:hypothetical protein ACJRO7_031686 [Eucalyptus globulus]|uniref:EF-hand domain-containing protein n=1 Tax=Eucalyptus globulus TaxID=34317 RepID=A0ABD3JKC3_EUCGL